MQNGDIEHSPRRSCPRPAREGSTARGGDRRTQHATGLAGGAHANVVPRLRRAGWRLPATGMRMAEQLGLTWSDVELNGGWTNVRQQWTEGRHGGMATRGLDSRRERLPATSTSIRSRWKPSLHFASLSGTSAATPVESTTTAGSSSASWTDSPLTAMPYASAFKRRVRTAGVRHTHALRVKNQHVGRWQRGYNGFRATAPYLNTKSAAKAEHTNGLNTVGPAVAAGSDTLPSRPSSGYATPSLSSHRPATTSSSSLESGSPTSAAGEPTTAAVSAMTPVRPRRGVRRSARTPPAS